LEIQDLKVAVVLQVLKEQKVMLDLKVELDYKVELDLRVAVVLQVLRVQLDQLITQQYLRHGH
jgi:hypothetical protein